MKQIFGRLVSWSNFYTFMWRQIKVYLFFLVVLCLFRLFFILWMHKYMTPAADGYDISTAMWVGLRISCKSAGWLTLVSLSGSLLANLFTPRYEMVICKLLNSISILLLSILYVARFPYYKQFHSSFNQLMFNTFNEDIYALGISLVKEFDLPVRLLGAFLLAFMLYRLFSQWLAGRPLELNISFPLAKWFGRAAFLVLIYFGVTLAHYGGSLGWASEVDWENAGVTKDAFLNEAILDDVQAVWRGYRLNSRLEACNGLDFDVAQIRALAAQLTHKEAVSNNLDEYLEKKAQGPLIAKPQQIFIIISESYANWPLLEKYKELHIADGMKGIMAEDDSDYVSTFLPNGPSTVSALTGIVTGFANANLYLTTMPEAFASPYPTASAPQLAKLGYKTNFWYAGPPTWERIGAFTTAQGYEHCYSRADFANAAEGNVWGCDDQYLYEAVLQGVSPEQPSFNVILNVSNHSPFTVDTAKAGFDKNTVIQALPEDAKQDAALVNQLGHYWYADKMLADFIHAAKAKYPDSLFIVIGDHADRYNIDKTPSLYERYGIPFIVTGKNVKKGMLPEDAAGSQIDVVPTLLEMIAPKDFIYYSLGTSLTEGNKQGVNYAFWITHDYIGKTDESHFVPEPIGSAAPSLNEQALHDYIDAIQGISWWRAKYGPILDENLVQNRQ